MDFVGEGEVLMGGPSSVAREIPLYSSDQKGAVMGIEINRDETVRLAREIAEAMGETVDDLIHQLVVDRHAQLSRPIIGSPEYEAQKRAFFAELDARRVVDLRPWKQIEDEELYDEYGDPIG
jgi:hypothetical protein